MLHNLPFLFCYSFSVLFCSVCFIYSLETFLLSNGVGGVRGQLRQMAGALRRGDFAPRRTPTSPFEKRSVGSREAAPLALCLISASSDMNQVLRAAAEVSFNERGVCQDGLNTTELHPTGNPDLSPVSKHFRTFPFRTFHRFHPLNSAEVTVRSDGRRRG